MMAYRIVFGLLLAVFVFSQDASASALPPSLDKLISAAASRDEASGDYQYLEVALVLVLDSQPEHADGAKARAMELAPSFSEQIIATFVQVTSQYAVETEPEPVKVAAFEPRIRKKSSVDDPKPAGFWPINNWSGDLQFGLSQRSGSTNETEATVSADLVNERRKWTHKFRTRYEILTKNDELDDDDLLISYQLDHLLSDRLYTYMLLHYRNEFNLGYDQRFLQSLGLGYHFVRTDKFKLSGELGPLHRQTRLDSDEEIFYEWGGRLTVNMTWDVFKWLDVSLKGSGNFTNKNKGYDVLFGLTSPLTSRLSTRLSFEYEYDTEGPEDEPRIDVRTRATIIYGF